MSSTGPFVRDFFFFFYFIIIYIDVVDVANATVATTIVVAIRQRMHNEALLESN